MANVDSKIVTESLNRNAMGTTLSMNASTAIIMVRTPMKEQHIRLHITLKAVTEGSISV